MKKLHVFMLLFVCPMTMFGQLKVNSDGVFKMNNVLVGYTGFPRSGMLPLTNVSFGYGALSNPLLTGTSNTAVGYNALYNNTTGPCNTAIGYSALRLNTTGPQNTAIGYSALYCNTTGYHNIAVGYFALFRNTSGGSNIAIGTDALRDNQTGRFNTVIGIVAGIGNVNMNNTIAIGYNASTTADNQVRIGDNTITSIGGYANWTNVSDSRAKKNINANIPGLDFINRLQPVSYNLDLKAIDELMKSDDPKINAFRDSIQAAMSPEEKKIMEESRADKESRVYSGFIAQEVEKAAKETGYNFSGVDAPENERGLYGLRYAEFVVPLVKAVQELSERNDAKDIAIASLQEQNNHLQKQIDELKGSTSGMLRNQTGLSLPATDGKAASLQQNIPNPFNQNTSIKYYLPETVTTAQLCIYDLQGKQLKQITLSGRGEGSETVSGSQFSPGIYLYALIADGQEVDVKRMILTE